MRGFISVLFQNRQERNQITQFIPDTVNKQSQRKRRNKGNFQDNNSKTAHRRYHISTPLEKELEIIFGVNSTI